MNRQVQILTAVTAVLLAAILSACQMPGSAPAAGGQKVEIVSPADGAHLSVGEMVNVRTAISDEGGAAAASLLVNGEVQRDDLFSTPMNSGEVFQPWQPSEPGVYALQVRLSTGGSGLAESNIVTVYVGGEKPTGAGTTQTQMVAATETVEGAKTEVPDTPTKPVPTWTATHSPTKTLPPTRTLTLTPTRTSRPTATLTATLGAPAFTADQAANCRSGPSSSLYDIRAYINKGDTVPISGKSSAEWGPWWVVQASGLTCWVYSELGTAQGDLNNIPVVPAPPLPTATPTPTPPPPAAPDLISPTGTLQCADVTGGVTLSWSAVSHPNGIDHYEWELSGPVSESGSAGGTQAATSGLSCAGANYQWRVRAVDGQGRAGSWSGYASFNVP